MTFRYTEQHRIEYFRHGVTVLRGLIPPALLTDLRQEAEKARQIARLKSGPQAQRLQPQWSYEELDLKRFRDFQTLPGLRAAVKGILGTEHRVGDRLAVFLEPAQDAWCTAWHRDWGNVRGVDQEEFFRTAADLKMHNQLNAALYDDHSLWVVPGSDRRKDTSEERGAFEESPPEGPVLTAEMSPALREAECIRYAQRMPGGSPVLLFAGDVAFYRACIWHLGFYVPYVRRATLHDSFLCEDDRTFQAAVRRLQQAQASQQ